MHAAGGLDGAGLVVVAGLAARLQLTAVPRSVPSLQQRQGPSSTADERPLTLRQEGGGALPSEGCVATVAVEGERLGMFG